MNILKLFKQNFIKGGAVRVIITSLFATLACAGIIYAATTVGTNISTTGTITGSGVNTLYGATSIGGALTATSTLNVSGLTTLGNASTTLLTITTSSTAALDVKDGNGNSTMRVDTSNDITNLTGNIILTTTDSDDSQIYSVVLSRTMNNSAYPNETRVLSTSFTDNSSYFFGRANTTSYIHTGNHTTNGGNSKALAGALTLAGQGTGTFSGLWSGHFRTTFNPTGGDYTQLGDVFGVSSELWTAGTAVDEDATMSNYYSYGTNHFENGPGDYEGQFNVTDKMVHFYGMSFGAAPNASPTLPGTQANVAGMWLDKQVIGDTGNFGIVLDGDDYASAYNKTEGGTSLWLGADQDASIGYKSGEGVRFLIGQNEAQYKWTFGSGQTGIDYVIGIDGQTSDLTMTYDESAYKLLMNRNLQIENDLGTASLTVKGNYGQGLTYQRYNGSYASPTIVVADDTLLSMNGQGYNGSAYKSAANITFEIDGTPDTGNDMPGRILFKTSPDGSATLAERMRIDNAGNVGIGTSSPAVSLDVQGLVKTFQTASTTCSGSVVGSIFYNSTNDSFWGCKSTGWVKLDN